jgi:hypothetical protein
VTSDVAEHVANHVATVNISMSSGIPQLQPLVLPQDSQT